MDSLWSEPFTEGFRSCFARYGVLGEGMDAIIVDGWFYTGFRPLTDPVQIGERVGISVSTDLIEFARSEAVSFLDRLADLEAERRELRSGLERLDWTALGQRWVLVARRLQEIVADRFANVAIGALVAEYVMAAGELLGWDDATAVAALGDIPASAAVASTVAAIAEAIDARCPALASRLREGATVERSEITEALVELGAAALVEVDDDLLFELTIASPSLGERPDIFVDLVRAHLMRPASVARPRAEIPAELSELAALARLGQSWRDESQNLIVRWLGVVRAVALEVGRRLEGWGVLGHGDHVFDLTADELDRALSDERNGDGLAAPAEQRHAARCQAAPPPPILGTPPTAPPGPPPGVELPEPTMRNMARIGWLTTRLGGPPGPPRMSAGRIDGVAASPGEHEGVVRIVRGPDDFERFASGDVLVCGATSPVWNAVMALAGAIVSDHGGLAGHTALTAREFAIPAVVGTKVATHALRDGQRVNVDGTRGTVTVVEP